MNTEQKKDRPQYAVEVIDLRKTFQLSHVGGSTFKSLVLQHRHKPVEEKFEVLKGISFTVGWGEGVTLIGRNGAGKSTLLALLSRVIKPTSGTVRVNGKVAPLLELGAGFIPDLTGYENIFLNGIMLGMTRYEVEEEMDNIIEFSELRKHVDAPVRNYSSGMVARLGFAIAAHVRSDIMFVDEALAVGDFDFQQKCLNHLNLYRKKGGTAIYVSHSAGDAEKFSDRCILLAGGKIEAEGTPREIMVKYHGSKGESDRNRL